jgi:hypothetical protein
VRARGLAQAELIKRAGFRDVVEEDITEEFLDTTLSWARERTLRAEEVKAAEGEERFRERLADQRAQAEGIEDGLLRRALYVACNR